MHFNIIFKQIKFYLYHCFNAVYIMATIINFIAKDIHLTFKSAKKCT